jgi:hypothetical protein
MAKRLLLFICLLGIFLSPAFSNLRAPWRLDGFVSGSAKNLPISRAVILTGEEMRVALPDLSGAKPNAAPMIAFIIRYEFENTLAQQVTLPVRFIAVDILNPVVTLNDRALSSEVVEDPGEKGVCLAKIANHRAAFLPRFYESFLGNLKQRAGLDNKPDETWPSGLDPQKLVSIPFRSVFPRSYGAPSGEKDFPAAEFQVALNPGKNALVVSYRQRLFIEERGHGYFASWPDRGVSGFDYLLYPAKTWSLDKNFRLRIRIELPDYRRKRFLGSVWIRPQMKSNVPFVEESEEKSRLRIFKAEFSEIPADILTFLFWLDKNAVGYLK